MTLFPFTLLPFALSHPGSSGDQKARAAKRRALGCSCWVLLALCMPLAAQTPATVAEVVPGLDASLRLLQRERVGLVRSYENALRYARESGLSLTAAGGAAPSWLGPALAVEAPSGVQELGKVEWGLIERLRALSAGSLPESAKRLPGLMADVESALSRTEAKWTGLQQWQQKLEALRQDKRELELLRPGAEDLAKWEGQLELEVQEGTTVEAWLLGSSRRKIEVRTTGPAGSLSEQLVPEARYRQGLLLVERRGDAVLAMSPLLFVIGAAERSPLADVPVSSPPSASASPPVEPAAASSGGQPPRLSEVPRVHYEGFTPDDSKGWVEEVRDGQRTRLHPKRMVHDATGIALVYIPAGEFLMGSPETEQGRHPDEKQHRRVIRCAFYLGETEVTQGQWKKVMGNNPSYFKGDERLPVEQVSWDDCQQFVGRAGGALRLPSEAEWEYACRAGTTTRYWNGDTKADLSRAGWYSSNSDARTHVVGGKAANAFGLYDVHGNVWEWCQDAYAAYPVTGSEAPKQGDGVRVVRGGGWVDDSGYCRAANRDWDDPGLRLTFVGCRLSSTTAD